jgi:hypothetical protein
MPSTTFEEASRCPKCNLPGEEAAPIPAPNAKRGAKLVFVWCRTSGCPWEGTNWVVQINPDGSVPKPYEQLGEKRYPKLSPESETKVREAIESQVRHEIQPGGGEVRNPHA